MPGPKSCAAWCLLAVAALALPAQAAETIARASQLYGWGVFDGEGKEIARFEDIVVDVSKDRLVSLLLAVGVREYRQVALPAPVQGARLHPQAGLVLEGWTREKVVALAETDKDALAAQPALRLGRDILRAEMRDREGRKIGTIEDIVVRLDAAAPVHVAVKFDPSFYRSDTLVGVTLTSFDASGPEFIARFGKDLKIIQPKPAVAEAAAPPKPPPLDPEARLTNILGAPVQDAAGAAIGQVKELAVDSSRREVTHVVVASAAATAAYPLSRFNVQVASGKPAFVLQGDARDATPVDAAAMLPNRAPASRQLRSVISDPQGKKVGEVEDVVINLRNGRLHFAVAEFHPNWVAAGWLVGIPVRPLRKTGEGENLAMQFDLNELNRAYLFQKGQWPDVNDRQFREMIERHLR